MLNKIKISLILIIITSQIFASGGSTYTRYGLGDLFFSYSARELSLGGLGISTINDNYINLLNPATWSNIKNTQFGTGVVSNISLIDDGTENALYNNVRFLGFHVGFPVKESLGIGFVLGMTPYSVTKYNVVNNVSSQVAGDYEEKFEGSGGLSKLFFGISYMLPLNISVGATFDYYTGFIQYKSSFTFNDLSDLSNSSFTEENRLRGIGTTFGLESPDLSKILGMNFISNIRLGLAYDLGSNLNNDTSLVIVSSIGEKKLNAGNSKTNLPSKLSFGLSFTLNKKYLFIFDYLYQPWSEFEQNNKVQQNLQDLKKYSFGIEYSKELNKFAEFWELIKYRGGLSYEQSQYAINGVGINQLSLHAGISFPLGLKNSINIGLMYGLRGTNDEGMLRENIFQASFSLNFGELWFIRRER